MIYLAIALIWAALTVLALAFFKGSKRCDVYFDHKGEPILVHEGNKIELK